MDAASVRLKVLWLVKRINQLKLINWVETKTSHFEFELTFIRPDKTNKLSCMYK